MLDQVVNKPISGDENTRREKRKTVAGDRVATLSPIGSRKSPEAPRIYGLATLGAIGLILALFWGTAVSLVSIWWRSETYAHGFLIVPIVLYLIWRRRAALAQLRPEPSFWGVGALSIIGFGWFLGHLVDALVIEQLALIALFPAMVVALLGWRFAKNLAFPLAYLVFVVPMGEALIPSLMDFTAAFTAKALQLTGIPVYREGTFFSIPSGDWSVVEGCSGLRYLISSVALGTLYAYLSYRSYWRRAAFIALAVVFPVIANGLRAYMIVMIAHLSDMRLALGIDHYIYGWVFFGLVMLLMFWIGSFWREDPDDSSSDTSGSIVGTPPKTCFGAKPVAVTLACFLAIALWPAAAYYLQASAGRHAPQVRLKVPVIPGWSAEDGLIADWTPRYLGMDAAVHQTYAREGRKVGLYLAYYSGRTQGGELINSQNVMVVQKHPVWQQPVEESRPVSGVDPVHEVVEAQLRSPQAKLLAWHWYDVAGHHTVNAYWGKLLQAYAKLTGRYRGSLGIVIYTEYEVRPEEAEAVLQSFLRDALPALNSTLHLAEGT